MYDAAENDDFDREEILTYEEVAKLYPRPGHYRPVVLIGPPGVGRNELKRRLIATDPDKYKTPVPCKFPFSFSIIFTRLAFLVLKVTLLSKQSSSVTYFNRSFFDEILVTGFRYLETTKTR